jgi:rare lipoprotein A
LLKIGHLKQNLALFRRIFYRARFVRRNEMEFKKTRLQKQFLMIAVGIALASSPFFGSFARENEPLKPAIKTGIASWYHDKFHGRKTANGDIFSQQKLTCASNQYPLGTWLKVTNVRNGKFVLVRVNDRMNVRMKRVVDLSRAAAKQIGIEKSGVGKVRVESYGKHKPAMS